MKICRKIQGIFYFLGIREDGQPQNFHFKNKKTLKNCYSIQKSPILASFSLFSGIFHPSPNNSIFQPNKSHSSSNKAILLPNKLNLHIIL